MTIPPSMMRSGSMATVRIQRRVRLAEKLKQVFDLDGIEEVWAGMSRLFSCFVISLRSLRNALLASALRL
jgi:hypothetical protein